AGPSPRIVWRPQRRIEDRAAARSCRDNGSVIARGKMCKQIHIGTAGWSIPRASAHRFTGEGTHLQRYARLLDCTEINSSFHRPHASATYAKWAMSTPPDFRFAVKIPRAVTHDQKLRAARVPLERFLNE